MIPTTEIGRLRPCLGRALDRSSGAGSPRARWERPPLSDPTMHRSNPKQSTKRVRIKARRADHPSHLTQGTKGADKASHRTLDTAGLLIKGTPLKTRFGQLSASGTKNVGVACPYCWAMLSDAQPERGHEQARRQGRHRARCHGDGGGKGRGSGSHPARIRFRAPFRSDL